jgi:V/A-type H+-transporting ATPase subunit E
MQNKLQQLTEKIFKEGISKGNAEAEKIINDSKKQAGEIIATAKKESDKIINDAKKKSVEIKSSSEAEFRLSSKQAINALKQQITELINGEIVSTSVKKVFEDKDFIKRLIEASIKNWKPASDEDADLTILLPEKEEKEIQQYFTKSVKDLLKKGIEIRFDADIKSGFQIGPKNNSYKISFTEEDFINFFKQYLRPRLIKLLFSEE